MLKSILTLLLAFGTCLLSYGQDRTISGTVTDDTGAPLPGATVVQKGTNTGAQTDFDGNYTINVSGDAVVLTYSYIGFSSKDITVGSQNTINVQLIEDVSKLDEVVVIGYGEVKRADLTGSVASVGSEQIEQANKVDAVSALQGQAPGVVIQRTDNKPGAGGFNIRIRGASTINSNQTANQGGFNPGQNPLFIVDGIFVDDISFLNPADIDKMDILKDASATAIYGSRGSNGVVIIETKRGKQGKMRVNYNNYIGFKQAYNLPSVYDGPGYLEFLKDVVVGNEFAQTNGDLSFRREQVDLSNYLDSEELQNVADGVDTDWVDLLLKSGLQSNHTIDMSGGNENTTYAVGLGYTLDEGTVEGEDYNRYNIRGSLSSDLTDWLNVSVNNYVTSVVQNTGSWEAFRSAYRLKPIGRPYNEDGSLRFFPTQKETQITNPLFDTQNITRETRFLQYLGDISLKLSPVNGLSFTTKFSPNIKYQRYGEYRGLLSKSVSGNPSNRRAVVDNTNYFSYTWDNILNWNWSKDIHSLNVTGVVSRFLERREGYYSQVRNFTTDEFSFYNLDAGLDIRDLSSDFSKQTLESYTGRINYTLDNKYLFTVTGRYDGASILSKENKWAFFPSAAFAWKMMEENFLKDQNVISNAKLRLSYGQTGNNGQGGGLAPLASQSLLSSSATNLGDAAVSTAYIGGLANEDLTWERTTEINVGIDFGFLQNRIYGSVDVYNRKNSDIIFFSPLPDVTGFSGTFDNVGESTNKGIEIGLNTVNIDNENLTWTTNFNFARNKNTLDKLYGDLDEIIFNVNGTNLIHRVGESIGSIYDYEYDGIWQLDEAAEAATYNQRPGQVKVRDINGDGQITPDGDRTIIGNVVPKWTGSVTSTLNYKDFDFTFLISTSQGNSMMSNFHNAFSFPWDSEPTRTFNGYNVNYWTPQNPTNNWYQPGNGGTFQNAIKYRDISFTKVGFITLGYKLPDNALNTLGLDKLRFYVTAQNPFIFTDYDGWDPENAGRNHWGAAFLSRSIITGINVSF
jgi:TonB-linked SusC/RagA family outer membrane protein